MNEAVEVIQGTATPATYQTWDGQLCTFTGACRRLGLLAGGLQRVAERYQAKAHERELFTCEAELASFLRVVGFEQESAQVAAAELLKSVSNGAARNR